MKKTYLYGPVMSRRLGRSLGVDVTPLKVCSFDCIYCQLGPTTQKTVRRRGFFPPEEILSEIQNRLQEGLRADYITFSGSGEPTLNADLGWLIREVKGMTSIPVAVITNSSLISDPGIQMELLAADLIMPSLDAASPKLFQTINRPHHSLTVAGIVDGLVSFRSRYGGQVRLEILLLNGINSIPEELERLRTLVDRIEPDGVDLNTVVRPPAEDMARPLSYEKMKEIREYFGERAQIVFQPLSLRRMESSHQVGPAILEMVGRRPCTLEELATALGRHRHEVSKYVGALVQEGRILQKRHGQKMFFVIPEENT